MIIAAHVVLNLDAEQQPSYRTKQDRQEQTDGTDRASNAQIGNDQGARAFGQISNHVSWTTMGSAVLANRASMASKCPANMILSPTCQSLKKAQAALHGP